MASISEPFIRRPVGTTLLAIGLFLVGGVAYEFLPVAAVPNVDFPSIRVSATRPGADPSVMAATVAAPLERRLGEIAGIDQITSTSSLGNTSIQLQFAIGRDIDRAARDVQAAINASLADLPSDLPSLPRFRKANSAAAPVFVLALTSKTISSSRIYDVADTVLAQRISQVPGVGEVTVSGADQPAVRIALNPVALSTAGIATDDVRLAIINANPLGPVGIFNGGRQSETLSINRQMRTAAEFRDVVIKSANGNFVRLSDVAEVEDSVRNSRSIAWFNKQPAVLIQITKQGDANVIDTVDRVRALLPELKQWIPAGVDISTLVDRTGTIRASVADMQLTLLATAILVMVVVFAFLRRITPTIAAGVSVPLAFSVGFVVDDAIVMIENMYRNLEHGMRPYQAALEGAKQIGFTVLSISLSLIAAFTPLLFMDGIVGRLLREFSLTLTFAIVVSTVVSLTITPMICAHYIKQATSHNATWFDRVVEGSLSRIVAFYARTLRVMLGLQQQLADIVMADPAVAGIGSVLGGGGGPGGAATSNRGTMFISLKPPAERAGLSTEQAIDRLRKNLFRVAGIRLFMFAAQDLRAGGRQSDSDYQYTLTSTDLDLLQKWAPIVGERMESVEGITDVSSDRDPGGLQLTLSIDRKAASSLGVRVQDIDNALNNAFSQRQISIVYTQRNQYMVVLEIDPKFQSDPSNLEHIFVAGAGGVSFAVVSVDHGVVQSAAQCAAGRRHIEHPARGRGIAHARGHSRQF